MNLMVKSLNQAGKLGHDHVTPFYSIYITILAYM